MIYTNIVKILKKINFYVYSDYRRISHPFIIHTNNLVIKTYSKLKSVDPHNIAPDEIDNIIDISDISQMDKLL